MVGIIIYLSPKLAFLVLVVTPLCIYPLSILAKKMKRYANLSQDKISLVIHKLSEVLNNFETIKSFKAEDMEVKKFEEKTNAFFGYTVKAEKNYALISPIMEIINAIAVGVTVVLGGLEVMEGRLSVGEFFSFVTALVMLYEPIKQLSLAHNRLEEMLASFERIQQFFAITPDIKEGDKPLSSPIEKIAFNNISLAYKDNPSKSVIKNLLHHHRASQLCSPHRS